jgi:hypothetical protein
MGADAAKSVKGKVREDRKSRLRRGLTYSCTCKVRIDSRGGLYSTHRLWVAQGDVVRDSVRWGCDGAVTWWASDWIDLRENERNNHTTFSLGDSPVTSAPISESAGGLVIQPAMQATKAGVISKRQINPRGVSGY